jgi:hypothetical protein
LALGVVALVLRLDQGRARGFTDARSDAVALALPGLVVAAIVLTPFLLGAALKDFYAGHDTVLETARDLASASFEHHASPAGGALAVAATIGLLLLTGGTALAAAARLWRAQGPPRDDDRLLVLVTGALVLALTLHAAAHKLLALRYPYARGCLWVVPLATLAVVFAMSPRRGEGWRRAARVLRAAWVGGLCLAYGLQLQTSAFRDYAYDGASRSVFERIRSGSGGARRRAVVVAAPPFQCPSFDFYQVTRGAVGPGLCRYAQWPDAGDWDFRILRLGDLAGARPTGARELFRDEASGTVVFVRE